MTNKDIEKPDLIPNPDKPPDAYLINEKSGESQRAQPAVSQWMIDDDLITYGGAPSFNWKEPLDARGVERLIFRLATRSAPERLEIKQLASIDSDGSYTKQSWAQPLAMLQWHHPRLYPERPANESPLRYNSKSDTPGWEIDVPLSTESATVYLNVSVNWYGWLFGQLRSGAPYMAGFRVSAITS
ncbi:MAG: hypothetical protein O3B95_04055 [Chloroflexi bacterium]|nr:hypothetical protein [Chloroflexota bacterium]